MKKQNFYYPSADGATKIHSIIWEPKGKPKAVLQIVHGMVEYIDRYDDFATFLTGKGFVVAGEDHLGHGESVINDSYHGYFGDKGNEYVIADIHTLRQKLNEDYPGVPYFILGHSMGSFLTRQYLTEDLGSYSLGISGAIIMGTGWQPEAVLAMGKAVAGSVAAIKGQRSPSKLVDGMAFGSYLKRIENPRTAKDWLTKDEAIVDKYVNDPWCTYDFSANGYIMMFTAMQKAQDINRIQTINPQMPILFCAGAEDPVGNYGEAVRKAFQVYKDNTGCQVDIKIYEGDRHEILNETDRAQVYEDMLTWMLESQNQGDKNGLQGRI